MLGLLRKDVKTAEQPHNYHEGGSHDRTHLVRTQPHGLPAPGGLRTSLTYLFAKKNGASSSCISRTPTRARGARCGGELIYKSLREAGLIRRGPGRGRRSPLHIQTSGATLTCPYAMQLVESGAVTRASAPRRSCRLTRRGHDPRRAVEGIEQALPEIPVDEAPPHAERRTLRHPAEYPPTGTASLDDAPYGHVEAPCDTLTTTLTGR